MARMMPLTEPSVIKTAKLLSIFLNAVFDDELIISYFKLFNMRISL